MLKCEKNHHSGFTMIELVVVVMLLGILSVFAMGRLFDQNQFAAKGFFDDTVNAVRFAQKLAISSGCDVRVTITSSGYQLHQKGDCTDVDFTTSAPIAVKNPVNRSNDYQNLGIPSGFSLAPATTMVFNARGVLDSGNNLSFTVSGGSTILSFDVYGQTGLVDVP